MTAKRKLKKIDIEEKIKVCQEFTQLWAQFFNLWGDGFEGRRVTSEDEAKAFQLMSTLARKLFRFDYMMQKEFTQAGTVQKVLSDAVSLTKIHDMTESQFSKFQLDWHVAFISMNKCLGRLNQRKPVDKKKEKPKPAPKKPAAPGQAAAPSASQQGAAPPQQAASPPTESAPQPQQQPQQQSQQQTPPQQPQPPQS
ncbi:MAG: hypothetical protein ACOC2L_04675 [Candidatus Sumerlaeota bacterium]